MFIKTKVLDDQGAVVFQSKTEIDAHALMDIAKTKEAFALEKGAQFIADGLPVFGKALVDEMRTGQRGCN